MATRGTRPAEGARRGTAAPRSRAASRSAGRRSRRRPARPTLTAPSAPAAIRRAILDAAADARVLAHRPRSRPRLRPGGARRRSIGGRLTLVEGTLRRTGPHRARGRLRARRRRRARHRRLVDAARRSRARLLLPGATGRSTCACPAQRRTHRRRRRQHAPKRTHLADILFHLGEERSSRAIARAIVSASPATAVQRARWSWPSLVARVLGAREDRRPACRRRAPSRRCASTSTTSWASLRRGLVCCRARARSRAARLAGRHLPLARGPARQAVPQAARGAGAARLAPPAADRPADGRPPSFRFVNHRPLSPTERRSPPIRGRARPSSGGPSAPMPRPGTRTRRPRRPAPRRVNEVESVPTCRARIGAINWLLMLATLASAVALYAIKHDTRRLEVRVLAQERALERARSDVDRARRPSARTCPARRRLEALARAIGMSPITAEPIPAPRPT